MKYLLPVLILINCHEIKGVFEWTVVGKVTDYGQNVTLFCHVPNCCPKDAGWDRWTPQQRTLFIDVKSGRPNKKYDGKVAKDGYTLIIQNLTKNDLNVSYSCLYGVTLGEQKFLLAQDVFTYMSTEQPNVNNRISEGQIAGIIVGVVVLVAVALSVGLLVFHFHRPKTKRNSGAETDNYTNEVVKNLIDKESESFKKVEIDMYTNEDVKPRNETDCFLQDPDNVECMEGDDAILKCVVRSGSSSVKWWKDGIEIRQNESYIMSNVASDENIQLQLTLMKAKRSDSGDYIVEVGKFYRILHLKIKDCFLQDPDNVECMEGENAILKCVVRSGSSSVKWWKDGIEIRQNESNIMSNVASDENIQLQLTLMKAKRSDSGEYLVKVGKFSRKLMLKIKEIPNMDERTRYLEAIQDGKEVRKYVRIQVIGKDRVGKTSLVRRLLGRGIHDGKSTDGIDIDKTCQIRTNDGEWIVGKVETDIEKMGRRMLQVVNMKRKATGPVSEPQGISDEQTDMNEKQSFTTDESKLLPYGGQKPSPADKNKPLPADVKKPLTNDENKPLQADVKKPLTNDENKPLPANVKKPLTNDENKPLPADIKKALPVDIKKPLPDDVKKPLLGDETKELLSNKQTDIKQSLAINVLPRNNDIETKYINPCSGASHNNPNDNKSNVTDTGDTSIKQPVHESPKAQNRAHLHKDDQITEAIIENMEDILLEVKNKKDNAGGLVECGIWDFAGQKDYYVTHQTFFTQHAIYLLVADITETITPIPYDDHFSSDSSGEYIDYWLDSIHCVRDDTLESKAKGLRPPVIMVVTGIDKCTDEKVEIMEYETQFLETFGRQDKVDHKRGEIHFISNTKSPEEEFRKLQKHISKIAQEMLYFAEELPTKWIELENALAVLKNMKKKENMGYCERWENIEKLAQRIFLEKDELIIFLNYQHKIGNVIFFEDKRDYIILEPSWLVDCFRCLVCDNSKKDCSDTELYKLKYSGELSDLLIDDLFRKVPTLRFEQYKKHILDVMEKFDIIVKPKSMNGYYMPCMIENSSSLKDIQKKFNVQDSNCTPWLVLEFKFLPIAYANSIMFNYIKEKSICKERSPIGDGRPAIFTSKAVVHLNETEGRKLVICFSKNAISLQIWKYDAKDIDNETKRQIIEQLCNKIEELETKLKHRLQFNIKSKCSAGHYFSSDGRISQAELKNESKTYFCYEHQQNHNKKDMEKTWLKHAAAFEKKKQTEMEEQIKKAQRVKERKNHDKKEEERKQKAKKEKEKKNQAKLEAEKKKQDRVEQKKRKKEKEEHLDIKEQLLQKETEQIKMFPMIVREKEELLDSKEKLLKIETEQNDFIPWNIRDQIQNQIEDWENKDKMFVSTRASDYVMECLQDNSCVTLTAPLGVGKSFIARHTALVLKKEGYNIIPVYSPTDIRDFYQPGKQTVFIVDDMCGNYTANQQQIQSWKQLLPVIDRVIADKCCKIIVSCRLQVYKDEKFNILSPFKSCECNLISDKLCLTSVEKYAIAKNYIGSTSDDIDKLSQHSEFFPLLCSLYDRGNNGDVEDFFKNPFNVYQNELDHLNSHGDEGILRICSLALCVIFNNQLEEKWFKSRLTDEQKHIIEDICDACEIHKSASKIELKKALDTLDGTFICKQGGIYKTVHNKLFDFLAHYFSQKMIECLIDHSESGLVHERFIWQLLPDDKTSNIDFIIEIPNDYLEPYLQRIIKDWSAGKLADVFSNKNLKVSSFRQILLQYLQQLDVSKQVILANTMEGCGSGTTPLILTCNDGYADMVQWLLQNDVDVDQCRDDGVSGLHMASEKGHTDIVKLLLERNPNVNICNNDGDSPLFMASQNRHTDIVKLLLERNPDVNLCAKDGYSPLYIASHSGHTEIVKLLLEKNPDVNLCDKDGKSPLFWASQEGHTDVVKLLLEKNPHIDISDNDGRSPLTLASQQGHTNIVKLLLEKNANANLCDKNDRSPLFWANQAGHIDIVELLSVKKPNVDICDNDDSCPLISDRQIGDTDM